jgi:hypothetical protein
MQCSPVVDWWESDRSDGLDLPDRDKIWNTSVRTKLQGAEMSSETRTTQSLLDDVTFQLPLPVRRRVVEFDAYRTRSLQVVKFYIRLHEVVSLSRICSPARKCVNRSSTPTTTANFLELVLDDHSQRRNGP